MYAPLVRELSGIEVSVLNREPMWLKCVALPRDSQRSGVSVLNREPMWLKFRRRVPAAALGVAVSVLNREPMWLK